MLRIIKSTTPLPTIVNPFPFKLDPFQIHALAAIDKHENVLVTAKTGSGKTLVGEYQILKSLEKKKRVFYTTPIKSLSNQKFHDLKKIHESVGIMTGDIKFCPQADIVIMTTEILRNLLLKKGTETENIGITANLSIDNLDAVVFDEVHYVNDPHRGKVWEECFVLLPSEINMVLLSATLNKPEEFASWLGDLKSKPIHLISTEYRVVPLIHTLPNGQVLMDEKERYYPKVYLDWLKEFDQKEKDMAAHRDAVKAREEGQDVVERKVRDQSFLHRMNDFISNKKDSLPALFFVLSRKLCVEYAKKVEENLITSSEVAAMKHIVSFHLHRYPDIVVSNQYFTLMPLLEKGVAFHHSGLLPLLKEIVEILFSRGLIKVLFATETFAVGLNMPTKTVVFTSFRKQGENGEFRMLRPDEYIQMAGRAGRRGKDTQGLVVYIPNNRPESEYDMKCMMTGQKAEIISRMDLHYAYVLQTRQAHRDVLRGSFWEKERQNQQRCLENDYEELKNSIPMITDVERRECEKRREIEDMIKSKQKQTLLNEWNNRHMGPRWMLVWKAFGLETRLNHIATHIREFNQTPTEIIQRTRTLEELGFIDTPMGTIATEIHEGHPLLMAYAFHKRLFHHLSGNDLVVALSCFLEYNKDEEKDPHIEIQELERVAAEMRSHEYIPSVDTYWKLCRSWVVIVKRWMEGDTSKNICADYGIDEGTFVRNILKLSALAEEWKNIATFLQDTDMVEKMKDLEIIREVVVPDSLYLRI